MKKLILCAAAAMVAGVVGCSSGDDRSENGDGEPIGEPVAGTAAPGAGIEGSTPVLYALRGEAEVVDGMISLVPSGEVTWVADRPVRGAGSFSPVHFVRSWPAAGFDSDPPNAVLMTADQSIPVELADAEWDAADGAIRMEVTPLDGATPTGSSGEVELFIDDAFSCQEGALFLMVSAWPDGATPPHDCMDAFEQYFPVSQANGMKRSTTLTLFGVEWSCVRSFRSMNHMEQVCTSGSSTMSVSSY